MNAPLPSRCLKRTLEIFKHNDVKRLKFSLCVIRQCIFDNDRMVEKLQHIDMNVNSISFEYEQQFFVICIQVLKLIN